MTETPTTITKPVELHRASFEVDDFDETDHQGWSVVVHGRAQTVAEPSELIRMWTSSGVVPWASGIRNLFIQITPHHLTGRRVVAGAA